jgi:NNP family nitrate/nitrite transporter-like MFS transporter
MKLSRLFLFWSLWYLAFSSRSIISPLLPLIEESLSISHASAGGLYMFMATGSTLAVGLAGFMALRIGYKKLIIIGFLFLSGSTAGLTFADSYQAFAILLFMLGFFNGVYLPCAIPVITTSFERKHWGKALAFHETAAGFSLLSIPYAIAFLLDLVHWRNIFWLVGAVILPVIILFWLSAPTPKADKKQKPHRSNIFKRSEFWIIAILWVACGISSVGVYNIIPLYLVSEKAMALEQANRIFSLSRIGGFVGQICIGFFLDRYSTKKILFFLVSASGIFTIGLALVQSSWLLIVMLFLQASFCVVFFPVGMVAISKLTTVEDRSIFTGTIMSASGMMSIGAAPLVLGAVADTYSFSLGLMILGLLTLCAGPSIRWLKGLD